MSRTHFLPLAILSLAFLLPSSGVQAASPLPAPEPVDGSVLCPPGLYTSQPDDCLPLGPSSYLENLAQAGIPWPVRPLPAYKPDPGLNSIPFQYFKVEKTGTYVFPTMDSAKNDATSGLMIGPGNLLYASFLERFDTDSGVYYSLRNGGWIRGEGAQAALFYPFQGLLFSSTPQNDFGWILGETESRSAPGYDKPYTGKKYYRFQVVQVYALHQVGDMNWLLIGPDEWLEARMVARVTPRHSSPPGVAASRWIEINLFEQTLAVYDNNTLIFATMVSTGEDKFWTRPGVFTIYEKKTAETMSGSFEADRSDYYYLEDVPWTMYFDGKRAMHGAYWHSMFGYQMSHGCVNMSLGDSHWLYDWSHNGDVVYVFDPSGKTPADDSLYGAGAP